EQRATAAEQLLQPCRVCPRECLAQRLQGTTGVCGVAEHALVSSYGPHFGEERPLVGVGGSGTIFLAHCNLRCVFCQNFEISQQEGGRVVSAKELAQMMLQLQGMGCHNINFVTPTHQAPQILKALPIAVEGGLQVPLVYNCGGYESLDMLQLLDGVFDIYMPDFKYADADTAKKYSQVEDYPEVAKAALRLMHRQVGDLTLDRRGIARRGLLVRHLILPNNLAGTAEVVLFLAGLSEDTYVNIMGQYRPCYRAHEYPPLARRPTRAELDEARQLARTAGLHRLDG
ncbi:MAG TPA: radical SAM protein, partial [Candidatus Acidoferrum sp.]|nr:radical SAM protein [Candidatus Acidoferrum sp.]